MSGTAPAGSRACAARCRARRPIPPDNGRMRPEQLALLEADRRGLIAAVERVPDADRNRQPAEGRWSVLQVLEHLGAVERSVTKLIALRGREPVPPDQPPPIPLASERVASLRQRDRRIDVPD